MIASLLRLEWYFIKELHVEWQSEFDASESLAIAVSDLSVDVVPNQNKEDPTRWGFEVSVTLIDKSGKRFPYIFKIILVGFFEVAKAYYDHNPDSAELLAIVNGPAVLYSAAREQVATFTSRGPHPEIILPTVTFLPIGGEGERPSKAQVAKPVAQPKLRTAKKKTTKRLPQK